MATGKVNATSLNLRSSPDTGASPPVAILILNAAVDILGANDDGSFCLVSTLVDGHTRMAGFKRSSSIWTNRRQSINRRMSRTTSPRFRLGSGALRDPERA